MKVTVRRFLARTAAGFFEGGFEHPQRAQSGAGELPVLDLLAERCQHGTGRGDDQLVVALCAVAIHAIPRTAKLG
jgi:hypothetical protein